MYSVMKTPICNLKIEEIDGFVTRICFTKEDCIAATNPLLERAETQLREYFEGQRYDFDLPLKFCGTEFQKRVWNALMEIPYGQTRTYKDLAGMAGNEKASRAVGMACNKNPIVIVAPCHRVIGANGSLVGYAGGIDVKKKILELEREFFMQKKFKDFE